MAVKECVDMENISRHYPYLVIVRVPQYERLHIHSDILF